MRNKGLLVTLATSIALGVAAVSFGVTASAMILEATSTSQVFAPTYAYGTTLRIENGSTIEVEGATVLVENAYLAQPNGATIKGKSFKLDQYGEYSLTLEGTLSGKKVSAKRTFSVKKEYYSVGMSSSLIDYGSLNPNFNQVGYPNGLKIGLSEGDTFTYNEPINIYENNLTSIVYWNLIEIEPSVHYVTTRVTDAYDSSNYFEIIWHRGNIYYECWVGASVLGGSAIGFESDEAGSIEVGEHHYTPSLYGGTWIHANNKISGAYVNVNYMLETSDKKNIKIYAETDTTRQRYLIAELNNEKAFVEKFNGFTTGDVYISMTANTFNGVSSAPIEIATLGDKSGEALLPMDFYEDTKAPIFLFDADYDGSQIVSGVPLSIPTPEVLDDSGVRGEIETAVYYGRGSEAERIVKVEDGRFIPNEYGVYSVVYTASDIYGNKGEKTIDLYCGESGKTGIDFKVNPISSVYAGTSVKFNDFTIRSRNGEASVSIAVTSPSGITKTLSSIDEYYLIDELGDYIVEYSYSDILYSGKTSYVFESANSGKPNFSATTISGLSDYYLSNFTYSLEEVPAYVYSSGRAERAEVVGFASYDGGDYESIDYKSFKIKNGVSSVKFKLAVKSNQDVFLESEAKKVIPVLNNGTLMLGNYFQGDFSNEVSSERITYTPNKSGDLSLDFVNKILLSSFRLDLNFASVGSSMDIVLTDLFDETNSLVVACFAAGGYSVNGGAKKSLSNWTDRRISFSYNKDASSFFIGETSFDLANPFSNDLCKLSIKVHESSGSGSLGISQIMNQPLDSSVTKDRVAPVYSVVMPSAIGFLNDEVKVNRLFAADALSPAPDSSSSMGAYYSSDDDNIPMVDTNGVTLVNVTDFTSEHIIKLDRYGYYLVTYSCEDGKGNRVYGGISQGISVIDDIAPTLSFASYDGKTVTVNSGSPFTPLEVNVSDNVSKEENISLWYFAYDSETRRMGTCKKGETMTLTEKGEYTIYVLAQDEAGNSATLSYKVLVK